MSHHARLGGLAAAFMLAAGAAQALTIGVLFDETPDGAVSAPFVGSATLTLDGYQPGSGDDIFAASDLASRGEDPLADGIYNLGDFADFE